MPEESDFSFGLDGGIVTTSLDEVIATPNLRESDNTRLSILRGTLVAAPTPVTLTAVEGGAECGGIVPAGHVDSSVAFFSKGGGDTRRIAGTDVTVLQSILQPPATQNAYQPTEIARAGVIPGTLEPRPPILCIHLGTRVFASVRPNPLIAGDVGVYITALDADGKVVLTPELACSLGVESPVYELQATVWVGLTSHGSSGIRLWYLRSGKIRRRTLTITGLDLTVGAEVDHSDSDSVLGYQIDICSDGADYAYLLHRTVTSSVLDKVDVVADTFSRLTLTSTAPGPVALSYLSTPSFPYLAVTFAATSQWYKALFRADTFVNLWHTLTSGSAAGAETAVQWLVEPDGNIFPVFAITKDGDLSALSPGFVLFQACNFATGAIDRVGRKNTNWMRLCDRGATVSLNGVERLPVFTLARCYNYGTATATEGVEANNYVADPSRELYAVVRGVPGQLHMAPIARFGVDIALRGRSPVGQFSAILGSNTCAVDSMLLSRRVVITYLAENYEQTQSALGHVPRFVEVDFTPKQPRFERDSAGVAIIAAAQPATWDGMEIVEAGPLHMPKVRVYDAGGTGPDLTGGTYLFRAVISVRDAAGQLHRSAPSLVGTVIGTLAAPAKPRVYVPVADTLRNGLSQEEFDVTIYQAGPLIDADGAGSNDYWSRTDYLPVSKTDVWEFSIITEDPPDDSTLLYSTGAPDEELVPEAPPPLWDVAMVGLRAWGIHGELRRRVVYTKKKADGIALEWNGALYVDMPPESGDLIAITELDGKPLVFGEHGVYVFDGEGPDNLGDGAYGDPRCVARVACTSRESVVRFPGGVLFQSSTRFVMMVAGGGLQFVDEIDVEPITAIASSIVLPKGQEVVFVPRTGTLERAVAYNFVLNRWTTWSDWPLFQAFAMATRTRALGFHYLGAAIKYIDVETPGALVQAVETGWLTPAGPQGNLNIRAPIIQGVWAADYTLRVVVLLDFNETTPAFDQTYTALQLADARDGKTRFTLRCDLELPIARAVRVRLVATSTTENAVEFKPVTVTIPLGVSPGQLRRHVAAGMK